VPFSMASSDFATSELSNTVCVNDSTGEWQQSQTELIEHMSKFGEIARFDMSLSQVLKKILVTFFDVRSAQQLILQHADCAEPYPPAAHDCRTARVKVTEFTENFRQFGDILNITLFQGDALVEFYDMRAAQLLLTAAGGSASPWHFTLKVSPPQLPPGLGIESDEVLPGTNMTSGPVVDMATQPSQQQQSVGETADLSTAQSGKKLSRPVRTKVTTKDFSKYDINSEKIKSGEETRTTVMVRNLVRPSSRTDFLGFLEKCGLQSRYTFFYMPCKENRSTPESFAFLNFCSATDVETLNTALQSRAWDQFVGSSRGKVPAISYARFQGHAELVKHFSSSAVLHEQDPRKRPIFRQEALAGQEDCSPTEMEVAAAARAGQRAAVWQGLSGDLPILHDVDYMGSQASPLDVGVSNVQKLLAELENDVANIAAMRKETSDIQNLPMRIFTHSNDTFHAIPVLV